MNIKDAIFTRRTIRKYTGEVIRDNDLELILRAGFYSPSAHNFQPWSFVVVKDKAMLNNISEKLTYAKMLPQAGCGVIVCGDKNIQPLEGFLVEDCSASIENMLLMAHGIGAGAVWCGIHPVEENLNVLKNSLELPDNIIPVGMVVLGYPDEYKETPERFDDKKIHHEKW